LQDAIDSVLARVLDHLGLPNALAKRWGQDIGLKNGAAPHAGAHAPVGDDGKEGSHG
jgi:hypothetical protein